MEIIEYLFGTGASTIILLLIFFPAIAFIIQFIANIQLIKRLPRIEENLELMNERLFSIENFSMPQDIQCDIEPEEINDEESEKMKALKYIYGNRKTSEETEVEENNPASLKETIEYIIAAVLICIFIISLIIITGKK